jgi:regulator of sigma E protease
MPDKKQQSKTWFRAVLGIIIFVAAVYLIIRNFSIFGNVVLVLLGFGAVVIVHEFGHFVIAKLCHIKVEAFSIFMPPILFGVRRTEKGVRFRVLPELFPKQDSEAGEGLLSFTIGKKAETSGTEYRIGLIPFGGFVKLLGQDDVGPAKASKDLRSFMNKPLLVRAAVLAAGVTFNAISAIIIFMVVFLVGINLPPPVVGEVKLNSPAARAGLKPGDEIIEIEGKNGDLDFSNIGVAAALSDVNKAVALKVRHENGSVEDFAIAAEKLPDETIRAFGIFPPTGLTIGKLSDADANQLCANTGLLPGDRIKSVDGNEVRTYWGLMEMVSKTFAPEVTLSAERTKEPGQDEEIKSRVRLDLSPANRQEVKAESELGHIYSMVPRLRVTAVTGVPQETEKGPLLSRLKKKVLAPLRKADKGQAKTDERPDLKTGDVILAIAEIQNPTFKEMREITEKYEGKELAVRVLRIEKGAEKITTVAVVPKRLPGGDRALIGIGVALDAGHPVVAKTINTEGGQGKLEIPRGATITAVDGTAVASFYDIVRQIERYKGERITIDYRLDANTAGDVALNAGSRKESISAKSNLAEYIPFEDLRRCYRAKGATLPSRSFNAVVMGYDKTIMFMAQAYVTIKRIIGGLVSPRSLMGPVGILALSYRIVAEQPLIYYVYILGLISAVIAVFNLLPLPPFDGGLIVLLLVEKIKGSALSERTQGIIAYAGWTLVGALIIYVTFNDFIRILFG